MGIGDAEVLKIESREKEKRRFGLTQPVALGAELLLSLCLTSQKSLSDVPAACHSGVGPLSSYWYICRWPLELGRVMGNGSMMSTRQQRLEKI
jgi:hypothetical protein